MPQGRPIHIRVVTPITTPEFRRPSHFADLERPGLTISLASILSGPSSIESAFDAAIAEPDTIAQTIEAEADQVDAIVIDCMADPALGPARECVTIPVLGPSQTSMHIAGLLGHRFSVLTVLPRLRVQIDNLAATYGLSGLLASVRAIDIPVLELETDLEATRKALVETAECAIREDGAHAIIFGCTGLMGCAEAVRAGLLERGHDVPVIDPIPATIRVAEALVSCGLRHSKLTFPEPQTKPIQGYPKLTTHRATAAE